MAKWILPFIFVFLSHCVMSQNDVHYKLIENKGQWPAQVIASCDLENGKFFLEKSAFTYHFMDLKNVRDAHSSGVLFSPDDIRIKGHVYKVSFPENNTKSVSSFSQKQKTQYNYYLGQDKSSWSGGCSSYGTAHLEDFWTGIDLKVYSQDFFLKYDFIIKAHADAQQIKMQYESVDDINLENGRLRISTSVNEVWEQKPYAYQFIRSEKKLVECKYVLNGNTVTFEFPQGFNKNYDLIIDPEIVFSTYSGSTADNFGYTATYDNEGYLYSGSSAFGQLYPVTTGAYQTTHQGGDSGIEEGIDMALSKYDDSGTFMVWSTFLGGSGDDLPHSIIVNDANELFVYGSTGSTNFPITSSAFDIAFLGGTTVSPTGTGAVFPNGTDIVISHFNSNCTALLGSTYIGGSGNDGVCTSTLLKKNYADEFRGEIELDENGNVVIISSTFSTDFPMVNAIQQNQNGMQDAVILKIEPTMSTVLWSTFIGGSQDDSGFSVAINSNGELYACGGTVSFDFPVTTNVVQEIHGGGNVADGYIFKISSDGQNVSACTFWGKDEYDQLYFIEIDNEDFVYVYGQTNADDSELIYNAAYGTPNSGNLLSKFSPNLNAIIWSTVFGTGSGKPTLSPSAFLVDCGDRVYISGWGATNSALNPGSNLTTIAGMEITPDAFDNTTNNNDFYLAVFDDNMSALEYATFFGGGTSAEHVDGGTSRFDKKGIIYQSVCAGCGGNDDFPIEPSNAWSSTNNSPQGCNNGVFKFDYQLPLTQAAFNNPPIGCVNQSFQFNNQSSVSESYQWDFGDDQFSSETNPEHLYEFPGEYEITLIASDEDCGSTDTAYQMILIQYATNTQIENAQTCPNIPITIGPAEALSGYEYTWQPSDYLSNAVVYNPVFSSENNQEYTVLVNHDACVDTLTQSVIVPQLQLTVPSDTVMCDEEPLLLVANYFPATAEIVWSEDENFSSMLNDNINDPDIIADVIIPSIFYVKITTEGCTLEDNVFVNLVSFQTVIEGDFTTCANDTVQLSVLNPNPAFSYAWEPASLVITGQNTSSVFVQVPEETTFTVFSTTEDNCTATDEVLVTVSTLVGTEISATANPSIITAGMETQLVASPSGQSYSWTPISEFENSQLQNQIVTPNETTTYYVSITDGECAYQAQVKVVVVDFVCGPPSIYVPNAFTPNKDYSNEKMYVRGNNISDIYFVIYDRWGEKIFETKQMDKGWDGTFEGRDLDPDVYVYYLEATCKGGEEYFEEGNITLIR
jgi:gliding motility-associated-like protein